MQVHGLTRPAAASHLSLWFGGFAVGCFFIGTLSDRLGRRKPVLIATTHVFAAIWLVLLSGMTLPEWASYALFALLGLSTAGFSLTWACAKEVNPPLLSGMSTSVANMGGFLAGALLQPLVGWVMDLGWRGEMLNGARFYDLAAWRNGVLVVTLCALMGATASWWIRETRCRNIWKPPAP
jgi:MFS family permease